MKLITNYKLQKYLKSCLLVMVIALLGFFLSNYFYYQKYKEIVNNYVASSISLIEEKYPDVSKEAIIDILNKEENTDNELLEKLGITDNVTVLKRLDKITQINYLVTTMLVILLSGTYVFLYLKDSSRKNKQIENIIKTLKRVNEKNYAFEIELEEEGNMAILKDEVYKHTKMLKEAYENILKDKMTLKNTLADISHQIKTPLTSISILVDNLLEEPMDKDLQKEFLTDIRMQIDNINFLVLSLLKLSKFEADVVEFQKENINVKLMFVNILKNLNPLITSKNISIHLKGDSLTCFKGDKKWQMEALSNILKNCLEHTGNNKNIYINYLDTPIFTKITIIDEGKGIAKSDLNKVFNRFYNTDTTLNNFGIGLSLAKEIITKDNGKITIKSVINEGTTFTIKYFH